MNLSTAIDSTPSPSASPSSPLLTLCKANSQPSVLNYLSNSDFLRFCLTSKYFQKNFLIDSEAFIQAFYIQKKLTPDAWKKFIIKHPTCTKLSALAANQLNPFQNFNDRDVKIAILKERLRWNPDERGNLIEEALTLPSKVDPIFTQISQLCEIGSSIMDVEKDYSDSPTADKKKTKIPRIKANTGTWEFRSKPFFPFNQLKYAQVIDAPKNAKDCFIKAYQLLLSQIPLCDHFSEPDDPELSKILFSLVQGYSFINSNEAYQIACMIDDSSSYKISALLYLAKREVKHPALASKYLFEAIKIVNMKPITHNGQLPKIMRACQNLPLEQLPRLGVECLDNPKIPLLCELYNLYADNSSKQSEVFASILQAFENLPTGKSHNNTNALYVIKIIKTLKTDKPEITADLIEIVEKIIANCKPFMQVKLLSKLCKELLSIDYKKADEVYQQALNSIELLKDQEMKLEALSILLEKTYFDKIHPKQSRFKEQYETQMQVKIKSSNPKKSKWRFS